MFECISVEQAKQLIDSSAPNILDSRDEYAFEKDHIKGAKLITRENFLELAQAMDKEVPLLIYCNRGNMSKTMASLFEHQGFKKVFSLDGGFNAWQEEQYQKQE